MEEHKQANANLSVTNIEWRQRIRELEAQKVKGNRKQQESSQVTEESGARSTFESMKREEENREFEEIMREFEEIKRDMLSWKEDLQALLQKTKKENLKLYKAASLGELDRTLRKVQSRIDGEVTVRPELP